MKDDQRRIWMWVLFGLYCLMLLWLLLLRRIGTGAGNVQLNIRPLDTLRRYIWVLCHSTVPIQRRYAVANLVGNIGLFLPMGIFLPILFEKMRKIFPFLLWSVGIIILVELCQLLTGLGACDVDDLLLNTAGTILGWLAWRALSAKHPKKTKEST